MPKIMADRPQTPAIFTVNRFEKTLIFDAPKLRSAI
jgi:hypothetical protein